MNYLPAIGYSAVAIAIAGTLTYAINQDVKDGDDKAIGKAVACLLASHPTTIEYEARIYGQKVFRQILIDTQAKGFSAQEARQLLLLSTCKGYNPNPLPLVRTFNLSSRSTWG